VTGVLAPFLGDSQNVAPETTPDQGAYPPALRAILDQTADPSWNHQQPAGALAGALAAPQTPAEQTQRLQAAAQALVAARRSPTSASDLLGQVRQQTSGVNVPMLAAAGAFLQPTKTGGFGESLGNAMTTGASALQHQQQQQEQAALRAAMADDTAAYRERMADASNTRAEAYADSVQNMARYRQLMADLKASGQDQARSLAILKMQMTRDGVDEATQRAITVALIRADAQGYNTDARTGVAYDRMALDRERLEAQRAHWMRSDAAAAERARLSQLGINTRMIDSAMLAASKDIGVITGKKEPGPVIDKWLQEALRQSDNVGGDGSGGGGGAAAPAPGDAREGGERGAPGSPRGLRAATPQEDQQAAAWLQQYGDTPEKRRYLADQMRQRGVKWGP